MGSFFGGVLQGASSSGAGGSLKKLASKRKNKKDQGTGGEDKPGSAGLGGQYQPGDSPPSYHKGGKVKKTGLARLKKGERVLTKAQQKKMRKKG
jgi:hypothetical protein